MSDSSTSVTSRLLRLGRFAVLGSLVLMTLFAAAPASGMTDVYQLAQRTGTATDMTGSTQIYGPSTSYTTLPTTYSIGFTFYFDKVPYTTFSVNTSGLMSLGKATYRYPYSYYWPNVSTLNSYYPLIAGFWAYYGAPKATTGKVHYRLTGTAPNRILTVEWKDVYSFNGTSTNYPGGTWQVRLYEGSNTIEFWYASLYTAGYYYPFNIGIGQSSSRYINVWGNNLTSQYYLYPSGQYYFYRYPQYYPINGNTIFEFAPCDKNLSGLIGNVSEGGTAAMKSGDDLLVGKEAMRGNTEGFEPFAFDLPASPCGAWTYTATFTGPAAGDYTIAPDNGSVITEGMSPTINFTPQGTGERLATMTLRISNGQTFTYNLKGEGVSRIARIGDVAEGGTTGMLDEDFLLTNIDVSRNSSRDVRPFTIRNINVTPSNSTLRDANVSFTLDDPNGQYAIRLDGGSGDGAEGEKGASIQGITTVSTVLGPGQSTTPVITFAPNPQGAERGSGPQEAFLTVNADGEIYTYTLNGFAVAPVAEFYFNDERVIGSSRRYFIYETTCVGEQVVAGTFVIENINKVPVMINSVDVLMTENEVRQGTPPYPQKLDAFGQLIPMADYFLSENPSVAPVHANTLVQFPLIIQPGERRTYYLSFVSQRPGKRYARAFLNTNAINFTGKDSDGYLPNAGSVTEQEGIMSLDFFGLGAGSRLAKDADGNLKGLSMVFDPVKVAASTTSETWVFNTGDCDLRISQGDIRLVAGDVSEFELMQVLPNTVVDAKGDFIIPPGGSDKITARFTPSRSGSRRASVMLKTNDSTLVVDGVTDRGVFFLDLFGVGEAYVEAKSIRLAPAVIDGPASKGVVEVTNASTEAVTITAAAITGPSAAEITPDPSVEWPTLPYVMMPGETLNFGVVFSPPSGGTPGQRTAALEITLRDGDPVVAQIFGIAGTRTIVANPASMFRTTVVPLGTVKREYAVITNTGTFPVRVDGIKVIGDNASDYSVTLLGRLDLDPGESQFVEVTYTPTVPGQSSAQLEIVSNATNGAQYIELGGTATGAGMIGNPASNGTVLNPGLGAGRAVAGESMSFAAVTPNPARDNVTISYRLASEGMAEIALYDLSGRMVGSLGAGYEKAGEHTLRADLSGVANGSYYITIRQDGHVVRQPVVVVR